MVWLIVGGSLFFYLMMVLVTTWMWSISYADYHPKGNRCGRIGCHVGYRSLYPNQEEELNTCVLSKSKFWGFLWPIGLVVLALLLVSQGGLNSWRVKDRQRKADLRELEIREKEIRKIQAELRSGYPVGSVEWEKKFKELEQEAR